jgi:hypothetical protein
VEQDLLQSLTPARYRIKDMAALSEQAGIDPDLDRMDHGPAIPQALLAAPNHPIRARLRDGDVPGIAHKAVHKGVPGARPMGATPH